MSDCAYCGRPLPGRGRRGCEWGSLCSAGAAASLDTASLCGCDRLTVRAAIRRLVEETRQTAEAPS